MPKLFNKRKWTKKRKAYNGKSKKSFKKQRMVVRPKTRISAGLGFPKQMTMTHKYRETFYLTSTGGALNYYVFCANGMYDPNLSGTGHQPMYFDQMGALYDHYTVIGAKCKLKFMLKEVNALAARACAYVNDDTTVTPASIDAISEQTQGKGIVMIPPGTLRSFSAVLKWSAKKYFPGSTLANTALQGNTGANPTEISTFVLAVQGDVAATVNFSCEVELEQIAVWKELKDLASS